MASGTIKCGNKVKFTCYQTTNIEILVCGICDGFCENKGFVRLIDSLKSVDTCTQCQGVYKPINWFIYLWIYNLTKIYFLSSFKYKKNLHAPV